MESLAYTRCCTHLSGILPERHTVTTSDEIAHKKNTLWRGREPTALGSVEIVGRLIGAVNLLSKHVVTVKVDQSYEKEAPNVDLDKDCFLLGVWPLLPSQPRGRFVFT